MIKPSNENVAVKTAEAVTDNILPIIISSEDILVEIRVSIGPLSFSPDPKSIAGYIEPVITYITKKKARIPPKIGIKCRKGPDLFGPIKATPVFQQIYDKILGKVPV